MINLNKKTRFKIFLIFIFSVLVLFFTKELWLLKIADFLLIKDPIKKVDLIICLGGGRKDRIDHAISLYKSGFGRKLIFTGDSLKIAYLKISWAELGRKEALLKGCPLKDILIEKKPSSTYEEALYLKQIIQNNKFKSALIVSDPYHMRRIKKTFVKIFNDDKIKLYFAYPEKSWFSAKSWWIDEDSTVALFNEYLKLLWYFIHHHC